MAFDMSRQQLMWFATAFAGNNAHEGGLLTPHRWCGDGSSLYDDVHTVEV